MVHAKMINHFSSSNQPSDISDQCTSHLLKSRERLDFPQRKAVGGMAQNILVKAGFHQPWWWREGPRCPVGRWLVGGVLDASGANAEDRESKKLGDLNGGTVILHHLGCIKPCTVNNGINYQPQLVQDF